MEVIGIIFKYFSDYNENNKENRIAKAIFKDLKKENFEIWKKTIHRIKYYTKLKKEEFALELVDNISSSNKKIKIISNGKDKIYEFRIPPTSNQGVHRIYFQYYEEFIFVLDREIKTENKANADTAFKRYKALRTELKEIDIKI